jgi:hypothetical protein
MPVSVPVSLGASRPCLSPWRPARGPVQNLTAPTRPGSTPYAPGSGLWALGSGLWALGSGLWALGSGLWALGSGLWALGSGLWALGTVAFPNPRCRGQKTRRLVRHGMLARRRWQRRCHEVPVLDRTGRARTRVVMQLVQGLLPVPAVPADHGQTGHQLLQQSRCPTPRQKPTARSRNAPAPCPHALRAGQPGELLADTLTQRKSRSGAIHQVT